MWADALAQRLCCAHWPVGWTQTDARRWVHGKSARAEARVEGDGWPGADDEEQGEQAGEQAYADRLDNPQCVGRIHVIISTVCDPYFDWQTEGLLYSHYVTGMRGTITRIVSCSNADYPYPKRWHPCFDVHTLKDMSGQVRLRVLCGVCVHLPPITTTPTTPRVGHDAELHAKVGWYDARRSRCFMRWSQAPRGVCPSDSHTNTHSPTHPMPPCRRRCRRTTRRSR